MPIPLSDRPTGEPIGYAALIEHFELTCPLPRRCTVIIPSGRRATMHRNGTEWVMIPKSASYRLPDSLMGHLDIAFKHEGIDLRVLHQLFQCDIEELITEHIRANSHGQYTRRLGAVYEWMTKRPLNLPEVYGVPYIPLFDTAKYLAPKGRRLLKWKIELNVLGDPGLFCPVIRRTDRLTTERVERLREEAQTIVKNADPALLRRSVAFLLLEESKGSFSIEGEKPAHNRLERWGKTIASAGSVTLNSTSLVELHKTLMDPKARFVKYGLRTEGGWIGRRDASGNPQPDHISAPHEALDKLLEGLSVAYAYLVRSKFDPVLTAAAIGFGFVFIHPFEDGNGRLHRFIIQKALIDLKFNPAGIVLPVSAMILRDLPGYRQALEEYSTQIVPMVDWESTDVGNIRILNDPVYLYRYFDATRQAEFLLDQIECTIKTALPDELLFLERFDQAKKNIDSILDMPDHLVTLLISLCRQNKGKLSQAKHESHFSQLTDEEVTKIETIIADAGLLE
jgi:Fic/DOC family